MAPAFSCLESAEQAALAKKTPTEKDGSGTVAQCLCAGFDLSRQLLGDDLELSFQDPRAASRGIRES